MELEKLLLVFFTVFLSLISSAILDFSSEMKNGLDFFVFIILVAVLLLNLTRFMVWNKIHSKYNINDSYPLISIFFPSIFFLSIILDQTEVTLSRIIGVFSIVVGIFWVDR